MNLHFSAFFFGTFSFLATAAVSCSDSGGSGPGGDGGAGGDGSETSGDGDSTTGTSSTGDGDGDSGGPGGHGGESGHGDSGGDGDVDPGLDHVICDSDKICLGKDMVCDLELSVCVECVGAADCPDEHVCESGSCRGVEVCKSSKDCTNPDHVCIDSETWDGVCAQCGTEADCGDGELCVNDVCVEACASDKDCSDDNEICRVSGGYCNECHDGIGCGDGQYCDDWECVDQLCQPGSTACLDGDVVTCNSVGSGYGAARSCHDYGCKREGGEAVCDYPDSDRPEGALNDNGDFAAGGVGWHRNDSSPAPTSDDGWFCVAAATSVELGWPEEVDAAMELVEGESYTLSFRTRLTLDEDQLGINSIDAKIGAPVSPYTAFFSDELVNLDEGLKEHQYTFEMNGATSDAGMVFNIYNAYGELCLDDIWLTKAD